MLDPLEAYPARKREDQFNLLSLRLTAFDVGLTAMSTAVANASLRSSCFG